MTFMNIGAFHLNDAGATSTLVRFPDNSGQWRDWLRWGYDMWGENTEPVPTPAQAWLASEDLREAPYNVPATAKAVKLHIKCKAAGVTWANDATYASLQVAFRQSGGGGGPTNEANHAAAAKPSGQGGPDGHTPYDLNHVEIDVKLGADGKIEMYRHPSVSAYGYAAVAVYLAGYWE